MEDWGGGNVAEMSFYTKMLILQVEIEPSDEIDDKQIEATTSSIQDLVSSKQELQSTITEPTILDYGVEALPVTSIGENPEEILPANTEEASSVDIQSPKNNSEKPCTSAFVLNPPFV